MANNGEADLTIIIPDIGSDDFHSAENDILKNESKPGFTEPFSTKTKREDTALIVEDKRLYVSSTVLALVSPVFSEMFEDDEHEHDLPGKKYEDILEFVKCIYPNMMKEITQENVFTVLPLAVEYEVRFLKERCEAFMVSEINENTSIETLCLYLAKISEHKLSEKLQEKCIQQAGLWDFKQLCDAETKYPIPSDSKIKIQKIVIEKLNKKITDLKKENDTYENVIKRGDMKEIWFYNFSVSSVPVPVLKDYQASYLYRAVNFNFTPSRSTTIQVHGIEWHFGIAKISNVFSSGLHTSTSNIGMDLYASPQMKCLGWFCRVYAKFCLRNIKDINKSVCKILDHIFTGESNKYGYSNFISGNNLKENGFVDDAGSLLFEIKFLVEKPTFFYK